MKKQLLMVASMLVLQGCATYKYAHQIKMVSFDNDLTQGKSIGPIKGQDCTWTILGYKLGGDPTVDKAFMNAMNQAGALESAGMGKGNNQRLRYINNASTDTEGFNAGVVAKNCISVNGVGYL